MTGICRLTSKLLRVVPEETVYRGNELDRVEERDQEEEAALVRATDRLERASAREAARHEEGSIMEGARDGCLLHVQAAKGVAYGTGRR